MNFSIADPPTLRLRLKLAATTRPIVRTWIDIVRKWAALYMDKLKKSYTAADLFRVNIQFTGEREKLLRIPERIEAPQYSLIQSNISGLDKYFYDTDLRRRRQLIFTIYFRDKSPFPWKRQFVQLQGELRNYRYLSKRVVRLAKEVADEKGDFKYGIKAEDSNSNETIYIEDPWLVIYWATLWS
ncbi:MAG: hypothetical protein JWQ09_1606 [Segetibacter sp.]|nr:hypothetical protein [Segetibacter sp.]